MLGDDLLLTIAEVSMSFAGLVGIAGLFGSQARPEIFRAQDLREFGVGPPRSAPMVMTMLSLILVGTLLLASFGLIGGRTQGHYTACVFLLLVYSGYFFFRLVWSLGPRS